MRGLVRRRTAGLSLAVILVGCGSSTHGATSTPTSGGDTSVASCIREWNEAIAGSGPIRLQSPDLATAFRTYAKVEVTRAPGSPPLSHVTPGSCLLVGTPVLVAPVVGGQASPVWSAVGQSGLSTAYADTIFSVVGLPAHPNATAHPNGTLTATSP